MLVQLKVSLFGAFAYRRNGAVSPRTTSLSGNRRKNALFAGVLLLGGLSGCKFDDDRASFTQSEIYRKKVQPAQINSLDSGDVISPTPDVALNSRASSLPTPKAADPAFSQEDPLAPVKDGEHAAGWTGMYDVYWKLNWARKELLSGNVPHDLAEVITKTRQHCKRLASEFPREGRMDERLEVSNSALDHLASGLQQMNILTTLESSGLQWRSLPWGSGVDEMHRYLERIGLVAPRTKSSLESTSLLGNEDTASLVKPDETPSYATEREREAIALALRCERENHASPEELARTQFQAGLRDIVRLRDLYGLNYHPASVPGDDAVIAGSLHQEADSVTQTPRRFETPDKMTGPGSVSGFDPTLPPGQSSHTPLIR